MYGYRQTKEENLKDMIEEMKKNCWDIDDIELDDYIKVKKVYDEMIEEIGVDYIDWDSSNEDNVIG